MKEKAKILIAEDEPIIAMDLKKTLNDFNCMVTSVVKNGKDLINKYRIDHPDIIITDINLNDNIDGIDAAKKIRKWGNTPILFLTSYSDPETISRIKKVRRSALVLKPFHKSILRENIKKCFNLSQNN